MTLVDRFEGRSFLGATLQLCASSEKPFGVRCVLSWIVQCASIAPRGRAAGAVAPSRPAVRHEIMGAHCSERNETSKQLGLRLHDFYLFHM